MSCQLVRYFVVLGFFCINLHSHVVDIPAVKEDVWDGVFNLFYSSIPDVNKYTLSIRHINLSNKFDCDISLAGGHIGAKDRRC